MNRFRRRTTPCRAENTTGGIAYEYSGTIPGAQSPVAPSFGQLVAAITAAAVHKGWRIIEEAPGVVTAVLLIRSHEAVVTIGYDESSFWVDFKDSTNLNYNPKDLMGTGKTGEASSPRGRGFTPTTIGGSQCSQIRSRTKL